MTTKALQEGRLKKAKLDKTKGRRDRLAGQRRLAEAAGHPRRNDLLPDLQISQVPIGDLRGPRNRTRKDGPEQVERLVRSIAEFGFSQPVLVREGQVLDGWSRVLAARELGLEHVPAIECSHLDAAAARGLALALNRIAERGEWDLDALRIEFQELIDLDVDLGAIGFTMEDRDIILLDPLDAQNADEDEVDAEPAGDPVTRIGDIWQLGNDRIICGNALEEGTYQSLLGDEQVHAVLTDPPYNVPIKGHVSGLGKKVHDEFVMASSELSAEEFQAFLDKVMCLMTAWLVAGAVLFVFMDWRSIHRVYSAGEGSKLKLINLVVWYKQSGGMGSLYRSAHELIAVFCNGDGPRVNNVELGKHGRNRCNVWEAPGANRPGSSANEMLSVHATPKPEGLCTDALLDVTQRGEIVLDAFLGSGTTLIAAEKTGRVCRGIELEPGFVDVCIRRWERHTGSEAVLIRTGQSFRQVELARYAGLDDLDDEVGLEAGGAK